MAKTVFTPLQETDDLNVVSSWLEQNRTARAEFGQLSRMSSVRNEREQQVVENARRMVAEYDRIAGLVNSSRPAQQPQAQPQAQPGFGQAATGLILGNRRMNQEQRRLEAYGDTESKIVNENYQELQEARRRLAQVPDDRPFEQSKIRQEITTLEESLSPRSLRTSAARQVASDLVGQERTRFAEDHLRRLEERRSSLDPKDPNYDSDYATATSQIRNMNEYYRFTQDGLTDSERGLIRAGEEVASWGIVPRSLVTAGSGFVDMIASPFNIVSLAAGGRPSSQRFISEGLTSPERRSFSETTGEWTADKRSWLSNQMTQTMYSLPMTVLTMANAPIGVGLTYTNMVDMNLTDMVRKYGTINDVPVASLAGSITAGLISGGVESLSNVVQVGLVNKLFKTTGFTGAKNYLKNVLTNKGMLLQLGRSVGTGALVEGAEEWVDSFAGNLVYNMVGEQNKSLSEMVAESNQAFISGAFGGALFGIFGGATQSFTQRGHWAETKKLAQIKTPGTNITSTQAKLVMDITAEMQKDSPNIDSVREMTSALYNQLDNIKNKSVKAAAANILDVTYANGIANTIFEEMQRQYPDSDILQGLDTATLSKDIYSLYQRANELIPKDTKATGIKAGLVNTIRAALQEASFGRTDKAKVLIARLNKLAKLKNVSSDPFFGKYSGILEDLTAIVGKMDSAVVKYANLSQTQAPVQRPAELDVTLIERAKELQQKKSASVEELQALSSELGEAINSTEAGKEANAYAAWKRVVDDRINKKLERSRKVEVPEAPVVVTPAPVVTKPVEPVKPVTPVNAGQKASILKLKAEKAVTDADYKAMISAITEGRTESVNDLTMGEAASIIDRLQELPLRKKKSETKKSEPKPRVDNKAAEERLAANKAKNEAKNKELRANALAAIKDLSVETFAKAKVAIMKGLDVLTPSEMEQAAKKLDELRPLLDTGYSNDAMIVSEILNKAAEEQRYEDGKAAAKTEEVPAKSEEEQANEFLRKSGIDPIPDTKKSEPKKAEEAETPAVESIKPDQEYYNPESPKNKYYFVGYAPNPYDNNQPSVKMAMVFNDRGEMREDTVYVELDRFKEHFIPMPKKYEPEKPDTKKSETKKAEEKPDTQTEPKSVTQIEAELSAIDKKIDKLEEAIAAREDKGLDATDKQQRDLDALEQQRDDLEEALLDTKPDTTPVDETPSLSWEERVKQMSMEGLKAWRYRLRRDVIKISDYKENSLWERRLKDIEAEIQARETPTEPKPKLERVEWRSVTDFQTGKTFSNWENFEKSEISGRKIVHIFWIDGKPYGKISAAKKLGISVAEADRKIAKAKAEWEDREKQIKAFGSEAKVPSLVTNVSEMMNKTNARVAYLEEADKTGKPYWDVVAENGVVAVKDGGIRFITNVETRIEAYKRAGWDIISVQEARDRFKSEAPKPEAKAKAKAVGIITVKKAGKGHTPIHGEDFQYSTNRKWDDSKRIILKDGYIINGSMGVADDSNINYNLQTTEQNRNDIASIDRIIDRKSKSPVTSIKYAMAVSSDYKYAVEAKSKNGEVLYFNPARISLMMTTQNYDGIYLTKESKENKQSPSMLFVKDGKPIAFILPLRSTPETVDAAIKYAEPVVEKMFKNQGTGYSAGQYGHPDKQFFEWDSALSRLDHRVENYLKYSGLIERLSIQESGKKSPTYIWVLTDKGIAYRDKVHAEAMEAFKEEQRLEDIPPQPSRQKLSDTLSKSLSSDQVDATMKLYDAMFQGYADELGITLDEAYEYLSDVVTTMPEGEAMQQVNAAEIAEAEAQMEAARKRYQGTDHWLKAPNGKPTKLNERQWLQVRTENFKKWFGDWENDPKNASKVVDENGEPMVVYHWSAYEFSEFIMSGGGNTPGGIDVGVWFTKEKERSDAIPSGSNIRMEVFLNIKTPKSYSALDDFFTDVTEMAEREAEDNGDEMYYDSINSIPYTADMYEKGYDGIYIDYDFESKTETYIALEKTQIKSATANVGTFDAENPDIRYQEIQQENSDASPVEAENERNGFTIMKGYVPSKIVKAFKAFVRAADGSLRPLFVSNNAIVPVGEWLKAKDTWHFTSTNGKDYVPTGSERDAAEIEKARATTREKKKRTKGEKKRTEKTTGENIEIPNDEVRQELIARGFLPPGSVATTIKAVAYRPGWHGSLLPLAKQLGNALSTIIKKTGMSFDGYDYNNVYQEDIVFAEVEFDMSTNYEQEADPVTGLQKMPDKGGYKFTTNKKNEDPRNPWFISGAMKVGRILSRAEVNDMLRNADFPIKKWRDEVGDTLYQSIRGFVQFKDGKATLGIVDPDFSTAVHEQAHIGRRLISKLAEKDKTGKWKSLLEKAAAWAGAKDGNWDTAADEKFAQGYEKYLLEGKAPNPQVATLFGKIKEWMSAIVGKAKELAGIKLDGNIVSVYDAMLGMTREHKSNLNKEQKAESIKLKNNMKLKNDTSSESLEKQLDSLMDKFGNLVYSRSSAKKSIITNVDLGKSIIEIIEDNGFVVNGKAFPTVYDAMQEITRLLSINTSTNSVTLKQIKRFNKSDDILFQRNIEKARDIKKQDQKKIASAYARVSNAVTRGISYTEWRNALIDLVDSLMVKHYGAYRVDYTTLMQIEDISLLNAALAKDQKYKTMMQDLTGYQDIAEVPTAQLFDIVSNLEPEYYESFMNNEYLKNLLDSTERISKALGKNSEPIMADIFRLTLELRNEDTAYGQISKGAYRPVEVIVSALGKGGVNLVTEGYKGKIRSARMQNRAHDTLKDFDKVLFSNKNNLGRRYTADERGTISSMIFYIGSNEAIKDHRAAFAEEVERVNNQGKEQIDLKDVLHIYDSLRSLMTFFEAEGMELNKRTGKQIFYSRPNYIFRVFQTVAMAMEEKLQDSEVRLAEAPNLMRRELKIPKMGKLNVDLMAATRSYVNRTSRYIAYYELKDYYYNQMSKDIPSNLRARADSLRDWVVKYVNNTIGIYEPKSKNDQNISNARLNLYASVLVSNIVLTLQNFNQRYLAKVYAAPGVWKQVKRDLHRITGSPKARIKSPKLIELIEELHASGENQLNQFYRESEEGKLKNNNLYARVTLATSGRVLQGSPFSRFERGNWSHGHLTGAYNAIMASRQYQNAIKDGKTHYQAVEIALGNQKVRDAALISAGEINAAVNADPSMVFSPAMYQDQVGKWLFFTKFFINYANMMKNTVAFKDIGSKWSRELFNYQLSGAEDQKVIADRIMSLNQMLQDLQPSRIKTLINQYGSRLTESQLEPADFAKAYVEIKKLRDEQVKYQRDHNTFFATGRGLQRRMIAGMASYMFGDFLIQMLIQLLKRLFYEDDPLGIYNKKMKKKLIAKTEINEVGMLLAVTQVSRLGQGIGIMSGLIPKPDFRTTKGFAKSMTSYILNLTPVLGLIDTAASQTYGAKPSHLILDSLFDDK